jgi:kinesin family protein 18/19
MADGASSISVTVRVRPFTIREAAQLTKSDGETLFLGDGSLAAAPTPRINSKGIRPVIKVVDEKCLYAACVCCRKSRKLTCA